MSRILFSARLSLSLTSRNNYNTKTCKIEMHAVSGFIYLRLIDAYHTSFYHLLPSFQAIQPVLDNAKVGSMSICKCQ